MFFDMDAFTVAHLQFGFGDIDELSITQNGQVKADRWLLPI